MLDLGNKPHATSFAPGGKVQTVRSLRSVQDVTDQGRYKGSKLNRIGTGSNVDNVPIVKDMPEAIILPELWWKTSGLVPDSV